MDYILQKYYKNAYSNIREAVTNLTDVQLKLDSIVRTLYDQVAIDVPDLNLSSGKVSSKIDEQYMSLRDVPDGVGVSPSGSLLTFITYKIPLVGSTRIDFTELCSDLLGNYMKRGKLWIENNHIFYRSFHDDLKTSPTVQESIAEEFKRTALSIVATLNSYRIQANAENEKLKLFIDQTLQQEIKSRNDRSDLEKRLNPFG